MVLRVSVVVAALAPVGVTVVGAKLQVVLDGNPEQAKLTACVKPPDGWMDRVVVVELPLATVALSGDRLRVKSGAATVTVMTTALDVEVAKLVSPPYCAVMESDPVGSVVVVNVATPLLFRVPVPSLSVPLRKVTVPEGTVTSPLGCLTVAERVMLWPAVAVVAEAASVVVDAVRAGGAVTVTLTAVDVEAAKLASPL